jgi:hypothetical protein
MTLEAGHVVAELGGKAQELFLLDGDITASAPALAAWWAVGLVGDAFVARFEHARMAGDQARTVEDLDALLGLPYLDPTSDELPRRRVTVLVDTDVALAIDDAMVQLAAPIGKSATKTPRSNSHTTGCHLTPRDAPPPPGAIDRRNRLA